MDPTGPENQSLSVPATDRSFLYGDGVFETLLVVNGVALWRDLHEDRMALGAKRLGIEVEMEDVRQAIQDGAQRSLATAGVLRVTVSRSSTERGYAPSVNAGARITATHSALARDPFVPLPAANISTSSIVMGDQPLLAGIKHCNRLEQVLAAAEAIERGVDDVVLCNAADVYQCSSNANLFVLRGDGLLTSPCERSGVLGTRRRLIIDSLAGRLGLSVREVPLKHEDLSSADGMFLCNSIMGIRRVARWEHRVFEPNDVLNRLQCTYYEEARQCSAM
ncbi:aminodeoxychorismate lyase [Congregibacter brevis]|uniref:Aminodeoxychorismate lyase n=1 Tax=Congregibacter brevis TaxID=3081201 RepID=A0ABZ0I9U0_9GAMM|nr:aminodeoxychorismate lyase [Congregibacter sp. IMCC45268]